MANQKSWTLSGEWLQRVLDIQDCLGNADYTFYDYEITDLKDPTAGDKRITKFFAIRVEVEKRYRVTSSNFIKKTIEAKEITGYPGQFYTVELGGKNKDNVNDLRIDMTVGDRTRRFIIVVKPNAAAGSGGGAEETAINESFQAVYAAYCFNKLGKPIKEGVSIKIQDLKEAYDKWCHVDVEWDELYADPKWVASHIRGANRLWNEYKTHAAAKKYHFYRGSGFDDGEIKRAFLRCKRKMGGSTTTFSSEDKWNPADIWIASKDFDPTKLDEKKKGKFVIQTIDQLNAFILDAYNSDDLFGISLKKIQNATPKFSKRNLSKADWETRKKDFKDYGFKNTNSMADGGIELHFKNKNEYPMDVYLYFSTGKFDKFQARNFAGSNKGSWQIELKGAGAAQGRVGGGQVAKILRDAGERYPGLTNLNNVGMWARCNKNNSNVQMSRSVTHLIEKLLKRYKAMGLHKKCAQNNAEIAQRNTSWRYAKLLSLMLLDCIAKSSQSDRLMQDLYIYASSQSDKSGAHVKME